MTMYEFMIKSPILTFFMGVLLYYAIYEIFFRLPNRYFRSRNIAKHGWPPEHCDADGDFKEKGDE